MFCSQCGKNIQVEIPYCIYCGYEVKAHEKAKFLQINQSQNKKKSKKGLVIALSGFALLLLVSVVLLVGFLLPKAIKVSAYYPESGQAGTYVLVELNQTIEVDQLEVYYGSKAVQAIQITEDVIGMHVPVDGTSEDIVITYGKRSDSVPFEVKKTQRISLLEQRIQPSLDVQHIQGQNQVAMTLPEGFLDQESVVSIEKVVNPAVILESPLDQYEVYDIRIQGYTQLETDIMIEIPYDPALFQADMTELAVEDYMAIQRWDEAHQLWVPLYFRVDEETQTVHFLTDHLSLFALVKLIPGMTQAAATLGGISYALEWVANDVYISQEHKRFRILYSKKGVSQLFPDDDWGKVIGYGNLRDHRGYRYIYPFMVQDIGNILEKSLEAYIQAGFMDPTTKTFLGVGYERRVKVKIDSLYNQAFVQELHHNAFWDIINIPTEIIRLMVFNPVLTSPSAYTEAELFLTHVLAHELFHVIQRPYYGAYSEWIKGKHLWWMEATADYAANDIAWGRHDQLLNERLGPRFFEQSLNSKGRILGTFRQGQDLEYEYLSAIWIRYLVQAHHVDLERLIDHVAKLGVYEEPLKSIGSFVLERSGYSSLNHVYADFLIWKLQQGKLIVADFENLDNQQVIAEKVVSLAIPDGEVIIQIDKSEQDLFEPEAGVFLVMKGSVNDEGFTLTPIANLAQASESYPMTVKDGDRLYFVIPNTQSEDRLVTATIWLLDDEMAIIIELESLSTLVTKDFTAKVWAVEFEGSRWTIEPELIDPAAFNQSYDFTIQGRNLSKTMENITIEYDFGDGGEDAIGNLQGSIQEDGTFEVVIPYLYERQEASDDLDEQTFLATFKILHEGKQIKSLNAQIVMAGVSVVIQPPRIMTYELAEGATQVEHTFVAYAEPADHYRFEWNFGDGSTELVTEGSQSTVQHTYEGEGTYYPRVSIFALGGREALASDGITIILEASEEGLLLYDGSFNEQVNERYWYYIDDGQWIKHGEYLLYYKDSGNTLQKGAYEHDIRVGTWYGYHVNGQVSESFSFVDGIHHGYYRSFHANGQVASEGDIVMGKYEGLWSYYHDNGQLRTSGTYVNGNQTGSWDSYDADGKKGITVNHGN